jgi:hypothetical protein
MEAVKAEPLTAEERQELKDRIEECIEDARGFLCEAYSLATELYPDGKLPEELDCLEESYSWLSGFYLLPEDEEPAKEETN